MRSGGELGGAVAGSTAGAAAGLGIWALSRNDCDELFCNYGSFVVSWGLGTLAGLALVPVFVNEIGDALGGSGGAGWSLLGELIGLFLFGAGFLEGSSSYRHG